jgi:hypothetical protein
MAFGIETIAGNAGEALSISTAFTVTSATKLFVIVSTRGGPNVLGVTFGTDALTFYSEYDDTDINCKVEIWDINNPTVQTANIEVSLEVEGPVAFGAISFIDADLVNGTASGNTSNTANPSVTVSSTLANDICIAGVASSRGTAGATTLNGTTIYEVEDVGGVMDAGFQSKVAVGTSTTLNWTSGAVSPGYWATIGMRVRAAASVTPLRDKLLLNNPRSCFLTGNNKVGIFKRK